MRSTGPGIPTSLRASAVVLAFLYGAGSVAVLLERSDRVTSYFAATTWSLVAGLVAGLGLLAVGCALTVVGDRPVQGWLAILLGVTWLAPAWSGWEDGPAMVGSLATISAPFLVPLLVHVATTQAPEPSSVRVRRAVSAAYVLFGVLILARAAVHDPHRDRYCWVDCGLDANVLLVHADTLLARALDTALLTATVVAAGGVAAATLHRAAAGVAVGSALLAVAVPATLALAAEAAYAVFLLGVPIERFDSSLGLALFLVRCSALLILSAGLSWVGGRARRTRARMEALVRDLGSNPDPGELRTHLVRALGDDGLALYYWSSSEGAYVDTAGRPLDPDLVGTGTRIVRGGEPVALVRHDPDRVSRRSLERAIGPTATLVLDSERLRAERRGQVEELRRSRARVVAAADEHRRRLERDLHDRAQQRLLAATYELRLARAEAEASGEHDLSGLLAVAVDAAATELEELRDVAHGLFPAVLDEAGLTEALWSLTDTAPVPVELDVRLDGRAQPEAERAAYLVVKAAIDATAEGRLRVAVVDGEEGTVVEVAGAGEVDLLHLEDRVGAVGGRLETRDGRLRAVIP